MAVRNPSTTLNDSTISCFDSRLALFEIPAKDYSIESVTPTLHYPKLPIDKNTKSFTVNVESSKDLIDLKNVQLELQICIQKNDGTNLPALSVPSTATEQSYMSTTTTTTAKNFCLPTTTSPSANQTRSSILPLSSLQQKRCKPHDDVPSKKKKLVQVIRKKPLKKKQSWIEAPPFPPTNADFYGCALEQAPLWTLFRNLDLRLNQEPVNNNYGTYGIQAASFTNLWFQSDWRKSTG